MGKRALMGVEWAYTGYGMGMEWAINGHWMSIEWVAGLNGLEWVLGVECVVGIEKFKALYLRVVLTFFNQILPELAHIWNEEGILKLII